MNVICHSVNIDGVVVLLGGSRGTSTLHAVIELFAFRSGGTQKPKFCTIPHPLHPRKV